MSISLNNVENVIELAADEVVPILAATKYAQREIIQVCKITMMDGMDASHEAQ
ncbi:hypothetical protein HNQ69_000408 [Bartonella callosciuri]|uniref:Uncharacterized protein n=1 Tax=Bartonella callosciuri TaxID=686223 RepID=A0A840NP33_9HYPH|nr:hypothetical protein [Bartonella callosciuri]MBB5073304.1 hypothetical protein [Bartonella callosciuri]